MPSAEFAKIVSNLERLNPKIIMKCGPRTGLKIFAMDSISKQTIKGCCRIIADEETNVKTKIEENLEKTFMAG